MANEKHSTCKKSGAFKLEWEDSKKIFNNTWNQQNKPVEMYRTDLISAMKVPDHQVLDDTFVKITDTWKQEFDKGVQVPVDLDCLPKPSFHSIEKTAIDYKFVMPKQYYTWKPDVDPVKQLIDGEIPTAIYDMDDDDVIFLNYVNELDDKTDDIVPVDFEVIITYLDTICQVNIAKKFQQELTYSLQYDDSVFCEVCKDIYSESDNEMIFCDSCNMCVHQSCYGISKIPHGEWYCSPCKSDCLTPVCLFCMQSGGAFKCSQQGEWVHIFCALWIPEVGFGNVDKMEPITRIKQIPSSRWALTCCFCQERVGVCIQCSTKGCFVPFHPTCAYNNRCHMKTIYGTPENADLVKNFAFCLKHSSKQESQEIVPNTIVLTMSKRDELNPLYNNQEKITRCIQQDFYEYVDILDVSAALNINVSVIQLVFDHWREKRKLNGNNPLINLPTLSELVKSTSIDNGDSRDAELDPFLKLVSLRQDLERARVLCHMAERRERLKKRFLKSLFPVIERCMELNKPFPHSLFSRASGSTPDKVNSSIHSTDDESSFNISQSSFTKVFCSPVNSTSIFDFPPDSCPNSSKEMVVAHEVVLSGEPSASDSVNESDSLSYNYKSSEDPEWEGCSAPMPKSKKKKPQTLNKIKELAASFSRKITIEFSDKSEVSSSNNDSCHFSTPPTSPEFITKGSPAFADLSASKRKYDSHSSGDESEKFAFANTPPSPKNKENVRDSDNQNADSNATRESTKTRRSSKRRKPNPKYSSIFDCS